MAYIGKQPVVGNFVKLDAITTSATATYNLLNGGVAYFPQTANNCIVSLNGVIQSPTSAYTISGSTIVFSDALTSSDTIDFILVLGDVLNIGTPSDGTVGFAKVTSNLITGATAETSIAGGDSVLIYDDSASALRKMTRTNFVSGLGAAAGQVIQVVSATDDTERTTTSTTFVTGSNTLSVSITPSASANKIFIIVTCSVQNSGSGDNSYYTIFRDATNLGDTNGMSIVAPNVYQNTSLSKLDSPNTTSSITYQLYMKSNSATDTTKVNILGSLQSSITAFEIKG
jgi:hypothetical protein